jgi:hypothetical protein
VLAAQPAETEIKIGKLKFKPDMEEDRVLEMQGETVMSDYALKRFLHKVCTSIQFTILTTRYLNNK